MVKDAPASDIRLGRGIGGPRPRFVIGGPTRDIISLRAPARETPPATERPAKPDEKTERPTEPAEKEAERGPKPAAQERKVRAKARARAGSAGIRSWRRSA